MTPTAPATSPARSSRPPISSLYVAKAFAALLVVIAHIPLGALKAWIYPWTLIAVPIFFLISGYFLYSLDESKSAERTWQSLKKTYPNLPWPDSLLLADGPPQSWQYGP